MARKPRCVPGTEIPYSIRSKGGHSFLCDSADIGANYIPDGYAFRTDYRHPNAIWLVATSEGAPVVVKPDDHHLRTYTTAAMAAIAEEEIARINADYERERKIKGRFTHTPSGPRPAIDRQEAANRRFHRWMERHKQLAAVACEAA